METFIDKNQISAACGGVLLLVPLALALLGLVPGAWLNRHPRFASRASVTIAGAGTIMAMPVLLLLAGGGASLFSGGGIAVHVDLLAGLLFMLVSALLTVVMRFSREYLAGDPQQGRYYKWLSLTGAAVLLLVISGNLLQFTLCWMAVSLFLHQLLVFYRNRPGALLAARKKFIVSRLGDLCLIGALVLIFRDFGTWDMQAIFARIGSATEAPSAHAAWTALLLVAGAMLKSAQFPFHSWLPDTMETPTPVSALMHAGVINAGGFLIIRLHPLIADVAAANQLLVLAGGFTAIFGGIVMLTQASVKRALAFSTVSQMGFMMLECGLGAYGLALLHLIAHSFYKAHAFLRSGSAVTESVKSAASSSWTLPRAAGLSIVCLLFSLGVFHLAGSGLHSGATVGPTDFALTSLAAIGAAFLVWNCWRHSLDLMTALAGMLAVIALAAGYHSLHALFGPLVHPVPRPEVALSGWLAPASVLCFLALYVLSIIVSLGNSAPALSRFYVHARNGFYINTLANRFIQRFWPVRL